MPNSLPANLTNLTVDAVDVQRVDLSVHLDVVSGLNDGLRVRGSDTVIPGARGRVVRNRIADARDIVLAGVLQGTGTTEADRLADYQAIRDELEGVFDPEGDPVAIAGEALDGSTRTIDARTISIVWNEGVLGMGNLAITMESVDPDWVVTPAGS